MVNSLSPSEFAQIQGMMKAMDGQALGAFLKNAVVTKLVAENPLPLIFEPQTGNEFPTPVEAKGRIAKKVVRGEKLETFEVSGRSLYLQPERYASKPSLDVQDLQDGKVVSLQNLVNFSKDGIKNALVADAYFGLRSACKFGDANFYVIKDDGTTDATTGVPTYVKLAKRKLDSIINQAADNTVSGALRSILGRLTLLSDLKTSDLTDINRARFEMLSPAQLPGEYKGVVLGQMNAAKDENDNVIFPENEILAVGEGAGSFATVNDIRTIDVGVNDLVQAWELYGEYIQAIWFDELVWRIYVIDDTVSGSFDKVLSFDKNSLVLSSTKYVDPTSVLVSTVKVYSGTEANSPAFTASVDPSGKTLRLDFASPLSSATYKIINTAGVKDIGAKAFAATTDGAPIASLTI